MKILIVGAGAMGCLYGGKLSALPAAQVTLLDNRKEPVAAIHREGLLLEEGAESLRYRNLRATTDPAEAGIVHLVILFVKSTATKEAFRSILPAIGPDTWALTLQNGLGNGEAMAEILDPQRVIGGTTVHGALALGPGHVRHTGSGLTTIGSLIPAAGGEQQPSLENIADLFNQAGLETVVSSNMEGLIWDKLLVNVGINALTAITGLPNGRLPEDPHTCAIMEEAVREGVRVAEAKGVTLTYEDAAAHCAQVARTTALNRSSMLQDMEAARPTEVDMINGAVVREAEKLGLDAPVNRTLTRLVKALTACRVRE